MRKVISLLVAIAATFGISIASFADVDGTRIAPSNLLQTPTLLANTFPPLGASTTVSLTKNQMVLVEGTANTFVMPETRLNPGEEYTFKVFKVNTGGNNLNVNNLDLSPVTAADLNNGTLKMRSSKGTSAITSAKFNKRGSGTTATYNLEITTKEFWGTKLTDVEYTMAVTGGNGTNLIESPLILKSGWGRFNDDEIEDLEEGDIITITEDKTVILKKQFETLAKNYKYKNVEFEGEDGDWRFLGRVSGMTDTNFYYTYDVLPGIVNKLPEQDFKFLTFGAGVNFPTNGEMRIDVSDVSGDFQRMYTYLYRDGRLTPVNTTYDSGADELVFKTNYLGAFVITNREITDRDLVGPVTDPEDEEPIGPAPAPVPDDIGPGNQNQNANTGTSGALSAAVALGFVSLAAMGITRKK